jgi:hypothetical protein
VRADSVHGPGPCIAAKEVSTWRPGTPLDQAAARAVRAPLGDATALDASVFEQHSVDVGRLALAAIQAHPTPAAVDLLVPRRSATAGTSFGRPRRTSSSPSPAQPFPPTCGKPTTAMRSCNRGGPSTARPGGCPQPPSAVIVIEASLGLRRRRLVFWL